MKTRRRQYQVPTRDQAHRSDVSFATKMKRNPGRPSLETVANDIERREQIQTQREHEPSATLGNS